jgi:hypothetical protein
MAAFGLKCRLLYIGRRYIGRRKRDHRKTSQHTSKVASAKCDCPEAGTGLKFVGFNKKPFENFLGQQFFVR